MQQLQKNRAIAVALKKNGEEKEKIVYLAPPETWALGVALASLRWTENGEDGDGDGEETSLFARR